MQVFACLPATSGRSFYIRNRSTYTHAHTHTFYLKLIFNIETHWLGHQLHMEQFENHKPMCMCIYETSSALIHITLVDDGTRNEGTKQIRFVYLFSCRIVYLFYCCSAHMHCNEIVFPLKFRSRAKKKVQLDRKLEILRCLITSILLLYLLFA